MFGAAALDDVQHPILADAQAQPDLPVRLPGSYQLQRAFLMAIGLDALAGLAPKAHAACLDRTAALSGLSGKAPRLEFAQRVKQIDRRAALAGQLADQHHIDIARLGQRHDLLALGAIILGARSRFLPDPRN